MDELGSLVESLTAQIGSVLKDLNNAPSFSDQVKAFAHAIDWTEPWIVCLLAFHVNLLGIVLLTRRFETVQFSIFITGVMLVWSAEHLNALGAQHWKSFSTQNYFDPSGLFVTVLFSGPLMVICIVILIQLMVTVVQTMFKWKRAELKQRARAAARAEEGKKD